MDASLPIVPADQRRTTESYYSSISVEQLAGQVYEMAEQPWRPEQRKRREGAVVHVYVPNSSLRMLGGLLVRGAGGLRRRGGAAAGKGSSRDVRLAATAHRRIRRLAR